LASKLATWKISRRDTDDRGFALVIFVREARVEAGRFVGDDEVAFAGTSG
jgi:hypothetical protein